MPQLSLVLAEPGANTLYYGNFSDGDWKLSERPLLLMVAPTGSGDDVVADITVLTPKFEATRAKLLPIPAGANLSYVSWAEEANPYEIAASAFAPAPTTVYVDPSIRHFIVDGFKKALPDAKVVIAPNSVRQLRERKTAAELELMKCVNEVGKITSRFVFGSDRNRQATLLALRATHKRLYAGIRESQARTIVADALTAIGLKDGGCLTLFGGRHIFRIPHRPCLYRTSRQCRPPPWHGHRPCPRSRRLRPLRLHGRPARLQERPHSRMYTFLFC